MKKILLFCILLGAVLNLQAQNIDLTAEVTNVTCSGGMDGQIEATPTGGMPPYSFNWSIGSNSSIIDNLSAGTYDLTVTDSNSETAEETFTVDEPSPITVSINHQDVSCFGGDDGAILVNATGGRPPYFYAWSNGSSNAGIVGLVSGTYEVTIMDTNNCNLVSQITIVEPPQITLQNLMVDCETAVGADGEVSFVISGGVPGYTYTWSDGSMEANRNDLRYGSYTITITDNVGCTEALPSPIYVCHEDMILPGDQDICRFEELPLEVFAPGATAYNWSSPATLSCSTCPDPIAQPLNSLEYIIAINPPAGNSGTFLHRFFVNVDTSCIWPGDIDSSGYVSNVDILPIGLSFGETGPSRIGGSGIWGGESATDWTTQVPGLSINNKHVDANGDGTIDGDDTVPLIQNWDQNVGFLNTDPYDPQPSMDTILMTVDADTLIEGNTIRLPIILGTDSFPANEVYGLCFSIYYDTSLFETGSAMMSFEDSWLGTLGTDMIQVQRETPGAGIFEVGMVRTDHQERDGIGTIGHFIITVEDDILLRGNSGDRSQIAGISRDSLPVHFDLREVILIDSEGFQRIVYTPTQAGQIVEDTGTGLADLDWSDQLRAFPNPTAGQLYLEADGLRLQSVSVYNSLGQLLLTEQADGYSWQMDTNHLPTGTYYLHAQTEKGHWQKIILIQRLN